MSHQDAAAYWVSSTPEPVYRHDPDMPAARAAEAVEMLRACRCCPRDCGAARLDDEQGTCGTGRRTRVVSCGAHLGEEDCLRGHRGSGTIFFGGCNLSCVFCQNWDISQGHAGRAVAADELAGIMLELQDSGCHNVNLVSPSHVVPQIVEALDVAARRGLRLPVVYNTNAYDSPTALRLLDGLIDIYMPDLKFASPAHAARFCEAADYPEVAQAAVREMHRQVGPLTLDRRGLACRGVLVRHLVMPGLLDDAATTYQWLAREVSADTFINVMGQYHPAHRVGTAGSQGQRQYDEIDRRTSTRELLAAREQARAAGLWRFAG